MSSSSDLISRTFHFTFITSPSSHYRWTKNFAFFLAGAAAALAFTSYHRRKSIRHKRIASTYQHLGDAAAGAAIAESRAAVDRLLEQHLGKPEDVLPEIFSSTKNFPFATISGFNYAAHLGILCERHCEALLDFTGEYEEPIALDIGCGIGATTFELARSFPRVIGLDASKAKINAAKTLKERGWMRYTSIEEGDLVQEHTAVVPDGVQRERAQFAVVSDLSSIPKPLTGPYDAVLASNILCGLENPRKFLVQLATLVRPRGVLVLASSYDYWQEQCRTPRDQWLGGFKDKSGNIIKSADTVRSELDKLGFECLTEEHVPLISRDHARHYQLFIPHVTVWKRT